MLTGNKLFGAACALSTGILVAPAFADETPMLVNFGVGGGWYEPATSGQGFSIDVVPGSNQLVAYWFTYPNEGGTREWYVAQGDISGNSAVLAIYQTSNGVFDQPGAVDIDTVGAAFIEYESCESASFEYFLDQTGDGGEIALQRLGTTRLCEQFLTGANLEAVSHGNSWVNLGGEWIFEGCVQLDEANSHGTEWLEFTESTMTLEIANYQTPDCTGDAALQVLVMDIQRLDKTEALLNGQRVIANRYLLTDPAGGAEIRQIWYVDDSGGNPAISHGILDSPLDDDGFPTQLHDLFFSPVPDDF